MRISKDPEWKPSGVAAWALHLPSAINKWALDFPGALFRVSKQIRHEALSVLFSSNRICLCCDDFRDSLEWLQLFPEQYLRMIRKLDIVRPYITLVLIDDLKQKETMEHFEALMAFIAANTEVPQLFLLLVVPKPAYMPITVSEASAKIPVTMVGRMAGVVRKRFQSSLGKSHVYLYMQVFSKESEFETLAMMGPQREEGKFMTGTCWERSL